MPLAGQDSSLTLRNDTDLSQCRTACRIAMIWTRWG